MEKLFTTFTATKCYDNQGNVIPCQTPEGGDLMVSVKGIINAIIATLGIVAVVIIIVGGVQYMTSSGDAAKVKKAKDTILYGVIGLIICVLAFAIVNFVVGNILK